jgi:hypothetical protein
MACKIEQSAFESHGDDQCDCDSLAIGVGVNEDAVMSAAAAWVAARLGKAFALSEWLKAYGCEHMTCFL